jgi:hypothetical protein
VDSRIIHFNASKSVTPIYNICFGSQILSSRGVICDLITDYRSCKDLPPGAARSTFYDICSIHMDWTKLVLTLVGVPHPTGISQYQAYFRAIIEDDSGYGYGRPDFRGEGHRHRFFRCLMGFLLLGGVVAVAVVQSNPDLQGNFNYWNIIHAQNKARAKGFALWAGAFLVPNISSLPASDESLLEPFFATSGSSGNLELPETFASYDQREHVEEMILTHLNTQQRNRGFLISSKGYIGLGPLRAQVGDEICILLGCNQPLVVRWVGDHHLIVGQCYV